MTTATQDQLAQLQQYSSCEISDALIQLKLSTQGGYIPDINLITANSGSTESSTMVAGQVFTVKMVEGDDQLAPRLKGHFIDLAPSGSIILIQAPAHLKSAVLGGLLATAASAKGIKAVVIDGRCRDLKELKALGLPIFARGHSTLPTSPFSRPSAVQIPLTLSAAFTSFSASSPSPSAAAAAAFPPVRVDPGDILCADEDGVVLLQMHYVEQVLGQMGINRAVDRRCAEALAAGKGVQETFALYRS